MQPLQTYTVIPRLPEPLLGLKELAQNLYFSWHHEIEDIFVQMDRDLWERTEHNPVLFLSRIPQTALEELAQDEFFLQRLSTIVEDQRRYVQRQGASIPGFSAGQVVAYFSAEYGIAHCLPLYSGGLGVLAGDHLKAASDLNLPMVGVGLAYREGYFRQYLTHDGWQQERYPVNDFEQMPLIPVRDAQGRRLVAQVPMAGSPLFFGIWRVQVGCVPLYLLDSNIPENTPARREITARLYGGDLEMRLQQEYLLGIGGVEALRCLGISPAVYHMNEGHSAFAGLARVREFMAQGLAFEAAAELVAQGSVFTTHTPVPAGNDRFPPELVERYFAQFAQELGLAWKVFLALGRENPHDDREPFCMTVLALRLSRVSNGESLLHGEVSRRMWAAVWPQFPAEDVPIASVTNGVHFPTWVAPDLSSLYDRFLGSSWREDPDHQRVGEKFGVIPDIELWRTHERLRERLVDFVRTRLRRQIQARGGRAWEVEAAENVLDPAALTIGFARRFAAYKRAFLLLKDPARLSRLVNDPERPVQFVFAGKAHPKDTEGKRIIQELINLCQSSEFRHAMVFLEDYDMHVARHLVQGCDVWLNTPRRPLEACGTSGMKAMANGVLNVSTLDGWWDEAWRPDNSLGWAIGSGEEYDDAEYQDFVESQILYNILEKDVVPLFYERGRGSFPREWVRRMKRALQVLGPVFNGHRMLEDYARMAYRPAMDAVHRLSEDHFAPVRELAAWRMRLMTGWDALAVREVRAAHTGEVYVHDAVSVEAQVWLGSLTPEDVSVEIYAGPVDGLGHFTTRRTTSMEPVGLTEDGWMRYQGRAMAEDTGKFGFTVRVVPRHPLLRDPHDLGLVRWAGA